MAEAAMTGSLLVRRRLPSATQATREHPLLPPPRLPRLQRVKSVRLLPPPPPPPPPPLLLLLLLLLQQRPNHCPPPSSRAAWKQL
jgi:hypothetical protein